MGSFTALYDLACLESKIANKPFLIFHVVILYLPNIKLYDSFLTPGGHLVKCYSTFYHNYKQLTSQRCNTVLQYIMSIINPQGRESME